MGKKKKIPSDVYAFMRELIQESLRDWFKKEKWVRISTAGNIVGPCGTSKNKKNPDRCLPAAKARSLTKAQRAATARKKRKAGAKGKTVVKNTKKATVKKESRVYGDSKISDMLEKLARSIGREKFAMHILYDMPKNVKRDILNALDFDKGGIYNLNTVYADAPLQENVNAVVDKVEKLISKVPIVGKSIAGGIDKLQNQVNNFIKTAKEEAGETRDMMIVVGRYLKGETVSAKNKAFVQRQFLDLLKALGAGYLALGKVIPPIAFIAFVVAKLGLTDEVFALTDEDKRTGRGTDDRKAFAGKIKTFGGVKYVPYNDVLPFLSKGGYSVANENVAPNHNHKAAPYGSGYKKVTKEDVRNLVVGLLHEMKSSKVTLGYDLEAIQNVVDHLRSNYKEGQDFILHIQRGDDLPNAITFPKGEFRDDYDLNDMLNYAQSDEDRYDSLFEKKKKKDDRCTRIAKRKYDTWPSAYASGAVVRCRRGEIWKGVKEETINEMNCKYGKYFCPHDKVYKCRKGPKKSRS